MDSLCFLSFILLFIRLSFLNILYKKIHCCNLMDYLLFIHLMYLCIKLFMCLGLVRYDGEIKMTMLICEDYLG